MEKIDFVITWVDGNDPAWLAEKAKYKGTDEGDARNMRYRDWDNLRYWFRGIETFAPWVNRIFFVTWGHVPEWLNLDNPKLQIVKHEDYIPSKYLPTFSSRTIDLNFHRIADLSEQFVYFNDDMFLTAPVTPDDFFHNGLPCDEAWINTVCVGMDDNARNIKTPIQQTFTARIFDMMIINRNFDKKKAIRSNLWKWVNYRYLKNSVYLLLLSPWKLFPGMNSVHMPYSYLKSTYEEVWEKEEQALDYTCMQKFRPSVGVNNWLFSFWQIAKGTFWPRSSRKVGKCMSITSDPGEFEWVNSVIKSGQYKMVCINDTEDVKDFEGAKNIINASFEKILPDKSSFEK